ncbi:MAG TPA: RNA-binding S4 domain-containing protein [Firmicutes bacterium]|nr:RNA-binding S4 domain-containing protein [Bacillota bacterium]
MRIDKFLKVSRILKRRTVASDACSGGKVSVNGKSVKPAYQVKLGDVVAVGFAGGEVRFRVKSLNDKVSAKDAESLYEIIE